ncbi:efflux RND transporter periplasmic adaptor subunit [Pedobacter sp. MW01-1-1]|uniref:efflux RND transporter periplasmic adaptor subunit n=1 Tax=Pedobacter sp. MW01-1-1 TaxID=3383027 RepID=UPI003FF100AD
MKRILIIIVVLVVAFGGIYMVLKNNKKKNEEKTAFIAQGSGAISVRTASVEKKVLDLDFVANGNFAPKQELNFLSENPGRVSAIYVDEGAHVSKGQVIARIDAEIINTDKETAQANYANALKDEARYKSSYETGGITQQQYDQAKLNTQNAKLRLQAAQRRVADANIKSPINGIINKRYIEVGAFVNGQGTQMFEIVDVSSLKLKVNVNESQVASIKLGDKIEIKSSVFPDKKFSGKITFIAAKADASLNFPIEIEVANGEGVLKAGMYGTAVFTFPKLAPTILVPRTAFAGSVSSNQVYVLKGDSTSSLRNVVTGRILGDNVEVLSGLNEGETVITSGQINLEDGTKVSIVK